VTWTYKTNYGEMLCKVSLLTLFLSVSDLDLNWVRGSGPGFQTPVLDVPKAGQKLRTRTLLKSFLESLRFLMEVYRLFFRGLCGL